MGKFNGLYKRKAEADAIVWAGEKSENVCPHPGDCASGIWDFLPSLGPGKEVSQRFRLQSFMTHLNSVASSPHISLSVLTARMGIWIICPLRMLRKD
jgi:hypothetical protein